MSNMSYCRWRNTLSDFDDCVQAFEEMTAGNDKGPLLEEELRACKALAVRAMDFLRLVVEAGAGNDLSDLEEGDDERQLESAIDSMQTSLLKDGADL